MAITLKDIAEELGVSVTTVSRALSGRGRISAATRRQVMEKAVELGYDLAAPEAEGERRRICIVLNSRLQPLSADSFYGTVMVGIENECQKHGSNVFFQTISNAADGGLWDLHGKEQLDGMILVGADIYPSIVKEAKSQGIPVVLVDNWLPEISVDSVVTDNRGGILQLMNYLISKGHRRIGFIGGPLSHRSLQERYEAYQAGLVEHGIQPNSDWCWLHTAPAPQIGKGREGIDALIARGLPVTAVVTDNDNTALGVLQGCAAAGIRVPEDLSLAGFDNIELSEHLTPPLTTVHIHKYHMGKIAARRLHELMQGEDTHVPLRIRLGTDLVIRESVQQLQS